MVSRGNSTPAKASTRSRRALSNASMGCPRPSRQSAWMMAVVQPSNRDWAAAGATGRSRRRASAAASRSMAISGAGAVRSFRADDDTDGLMVGVAEAKVDTRHGIHRDSRADKKAVDDGGVVLARPVGALV